MKMMSEQKNSKAERASEQERERESERLHMLKVNTKFGILLSKAGVAADWM